MSLPWLKGAISGPIRAAGLTVTAAHFSADGGVVVGGGGAEDDGTGRACCAVCA